MECMQKSLRTPQNDPSVDLWTRYAGGNASKSNGHPSALASLAHLLPSSPQTPSTTDSRGKSIRRVVSCGIEWPTTETKKRKTPPKSHARVRDIFAASKKRMFSPELPRSGRVGLLLEKIQESLSTKPVQETEDDAEGPSSSSPIPDANGDGETMLGCLEPLLPPAQHLFKPEDAVPKVGNAARQQNPAESLLLQDGSSSDYGGDDIDYDFAEEVEFAATQANPNNKRQRTPSKAEKQSLKHAIKPTIPPWEANSALQPSTAVANHATLASAETMKRVPEAVTLKHIEDSSDDEFGLDDPDFAEELEDLAAKYESQDQQSLPQQVPGHVLEQVVEANQETTIILQGSSDEFDDPYDDDVWKDIANGSIDPQTVDNVGSTSQVWSPR
jgi:DNA replication ATP-dependent helicase Dna2